MARTVAVVGASQDRRKYGNRAVRAFLAEGYAVVPIHPEAAAIEGIRAYRSVLDVQEPIDMATMYVPPEIGIRLLPELKRKGIHEVWFNPGSESDAIAAECRVLGLEAIFACSIVGIGRVPAEFPGGPAS